MTRPRLIAIVDDWERLERYEDELGKVFDVEGAPFGPYGIEKALEQVPQAILLDLEFENMTENEARARILESEKLRTLPLVKRGDYAPGSEGTLKVIERLREIAHACAAS
jgi:hypothetical protein